MTKIARVVRFGQRCTLWLACGHSLRHSWRDVEREQLYVGKPVKCAECDAG